MECPGKCHGKDSIIINTTPSINSGIMNEPANNPEEQIVWAVDNSLFGLPTALSPKTQIYKFLLLRSTARHNCLVCFSTMSYNERGASKTC